MTLEDFKRDCDYIKSSHDNYYQSNERLMKYCQSVLGKCRETMDDKDFAEVLETYRSSIPSERRYAKEQRNAVEEKVNVYRRLAHENLGKYGDKWASNLHSLACGYEGDDAITHYEMCIEIYQQLEKECGQTDSFFLADCYCHAAREYLNKGDETKCLQYLSNAFEIHRQRQDTFNMAAIYYDFGVAYHLMGRKSEAIDSLHKAIETIKMDSDKENDWNEGHEGLTDDCMTILKEVLLGRDLPPEKMYFM